MCLSSLNSGGFKSAISRSRHVCDVSLQLHKKVRGITLTVSRRHARSSAFLIKFYHAYSITTAKGEGRSPDVTGCTDPVIEKCIALNTILEENETYLWESPVLTTRYASEKELLTLWLGFLMAS